MCERIWVYVSFLLYILLLSFILSWEKDFKSLNLIELRALGEKNLCNQIYHLTIILKNEINSFSRC